MTNFSGKHLTKDIAEVRCSVVEKDISKNRLEFLKDLLEFNGYEVHFEEIPPKEEGGEPTYIIGVTSMLFNPVIAIFQRLLKTKDGKRITADYWNQLTTEIEPNYWDRSKKHF